MPVAAALGPEVGHAGGAAAGACFCSICITTGRWAMESGPPEPEATLLGPDPAASIIRHHRTHYESFNWQPSEVTECAAVDVHQRVGRAGNCHSCVPEPQTSRLQKTRNAKPGTRNTKSETINPKPDARQKRTREQASERQHSAGLGWHVLGVPEADAAARPGKSCPGRQGRRQRSLLVSGRHPLRPLPGLLQVELQSTRRLRH